MGQKLHWNGVEKKRSRVGVWQSKFEEKLGGSWRGRVDQREGFLRIEETVAWLNLKPEEKEHEEREGLAIWWREEITAQEMAVRSW